MADFSQCAREMRSSEIRRLMALAADPSVISFAGGMPANALLPVENIDRLYGVLSPEEKRAALQYGSTAGYPPLIESLSTYLRTRGLSLEGRKLIVTAGAQQAINLLAKIFLDPGDIVLTENPSFIGALAAFASFRASAIGAPVDNEGIDIKKMTSILDNKTTRVKLVYLNPLFQNPAGIMYSTERKRAVLDALRDRTCCLIEDDPYGELYFDDRDRPLMLPLTAMVTAAFPACYVGSFSKIFGPGLRLGWVLGPNDIVEKCELAKQSMDACSSSLSQVLAHAYLSRGMLDGYLRSVRVAYARRAKIMLDALATHMPPGVTWTSPRGGFYLWVTLPETVNATDVFSAAIQRKAAFVIGSAFDPEGTRNNCFRLAFSHTPETAIAEGIKIVADAVKSLV